MGTTVTLGNIVVPLSSIVDQLRNKLSTSDIDALVSAILSKRQSEVHPGDLITADLMNEILAQLADLQVRVGDLESAAGSISGNVVIFRPLPGEQFRAGSDMTIEGMNLGISDGSSIIKINTTTVTVYRPGSSDTKVTVNIPNIAVGLGGQVAVLTVANAKNSADRQIFLLPAQDLTGHVDLSWIDADPLTPATGGPIALKFRAKSRANLDASYLITPLISRVTNAAEWNNQLEVLDKDQNGVASKQIPVSAGGETVFFVRIKSIPAVPGDNTPTFVLTVTASAGAVSDNTGPLVMKVGTAVELPDPNVSLAYDSSQFLPTNDAGSYARGSDEDTVTVKPNSAGVITMVAEIGAIGTYRAFAETVTGATGWTVRPHPNDPASYPIQASDLNNPSGVARILPRFQFLPGATPGDTGEVRLKLARDTASNSRSILMLVKKG
jgi:IPT/TIG domain-containing protein